MTTRLKICGLTNLADARYCAAAGADYLGFIQYEGSPRYVDPATAREIIGWVYGAQAVGVFVNADADTINRTAEDTGFALVQLHGEEPPEVCAAVERPVIKALHVGSATTVDDLRRLMERYAPHVAYFLLDTRSHRARGGTGERFDWDRAAPLTKDYPVFLAGGIDATNVAEAVARVAPFAVDLSSSLEAEPGRKDFDKLAAFFEAWDALARSTS
ncbi:phosphoribosylanthranilate isomerase [Rhodocaloribacter litoris]|uniref:phosphoribosylanthranilate isomerase n=1 Tax=Rhodocaloribacter litoris TaxID=2558931 RepID=UPI0014205846|nr:phosphoribosylanthranilate isomerase [Rhodocaloribacter litoris]QXD15765.1 phosphoribosylanthranilate isomerase [Rhodocaloribacter litoris]